LVDTLVKLPYFKGVSTYTDGDNIIFKYPMKLLTLTFKFVSWGQGFGCGELIPKVYTFVGW
jgi:hypothetical protein